jgi:Uma2 family endonuclease
MSIGDSHCVCVDLLNYVLTLALAAVARVRIQNPIVLDTSEPEPDVSVVRLRPDNYRSGKPQPADVFLIIEVADTTLGYDRNVKGPRYARNSIPEYWIVDLNSDTVLVHRNPQLDGTWASITNHIRGDTLDIAGLPGVTIAVADILP